MPAKAEATLADWTGRASDAEDERYERTKREIRAALKGGRLDDYSFHVYAKGSYPNHTNVVADSDVDIAVELTSIIQHEFIHEAKGLSLADLGLSPYAGGYSQPKFKDDVQTALEQHFGSAAVDRGNKAIHVRESSRSLKADVVVCETLKSHAHRDTTRAGIQIEPDRGPWIHNFPSQHYDEGIAKNNATARRYKRVVRILKRLENEMVDKGIIEVVPSFLIESLVWNVPSGHFNINPTWSERVRDIVAVMFVKTKGPEPASESERWLEANNVKFLFHASQNWTREQANHFALQAWTYLDFEQ
jgi:hypothetical protein